MDDNSVNVLGFSIPVLVAISTVLIGAFALLLNFVTARFSSRNKDASNDVAGQGVANVDSQNSSNIHRSSPNNSGGAQATGNNNANGNGNTTTSGKRAKNKKRREAQQEFTHSWMVGALKGHTGPVLDINFSSDGKFLASCAEDCDLPPEEELGDSSSSSGSSSSGDGDYVAKTKSRCKSVQGIAEGPRAEQTTSLDINPTSTSPIVDAASLDKVRSSSSSSSSSLCRDATKDRASLSRRQRKNRTRVPREQQRRDRDDENDETSSSFPSPPRHRGLHRHHHHSSEIKTRHCHHDESPNHSDLYESSSPVVKSRGSASRRSNPNCQQQRSPKAWSNSNGIQSNKFPGGKVIPGVGLPTLAQVNSGNKVKNSIFLYDLNIRKLREELKATDAELAVNMRRLILTGTELSQLGYPVVCNHFRNFTVIWNVQHQFQIYQARVHRYHLLDANAREFVPGNAMIREWNNSECEMDSGNGSGSSVENSDLEPDGSSDSDKSSDIGDPPSSCSSGDEEKSRSDEHSGTWMSEHNIVERTCVRCHRNFHTHRENGQYLREEECVYHWGKWRSDSPHDNDPSKGYWACCSAGANAEGCTVARWHVWSGLTPGYNGPFADYARTTPCDVVARDGNYGVYAIDCEMVFTRFGLELCKISLVNMDGRVVYDNLVRPDHEIIDYNTRFSGMTPKILARARKSLRDVQRDITSFVHAETILIGHGLENDLRALKLLHTTVIDTSVTFPHFWGLPFRNSLKNLARIVLKREIQVREHDSIEDARIAIELILHRIHVLLNECEIYK